jgi:hypothetical protein
MLLTFAVAISMQLTSPSGKNALTDAPTPYIGDRIAQLGKQSYVVRIKSTGEVIVSSKAMLQRRNAQLHEQMLQAVQQVTGCQLAEEIWMGTKIHGKLACVSKPTGPVPTGANP